MQPAATATSETVGTHHNTGQSLQTRQFDFPHIHKGIDSHSELGQQTERSEIQRRDWSRVVAVGFHRNTSDRDAGQRGTQQKHIVITRHHERFGVGR